MRVRLGAWLLLSCWTGAARGQFNYVGSTYSQNFDSLASSGAPAWTNNATLNGWYLFRQPGAPLDALTSYSTGTGSSATGGIYSFGSAAATDRALGGIGAQAAVFNNPASGNVAAWIAFSATNNTGTALGQFSFAYDGEQWRDGGATGAAQTMKVEFGFGSTFGPGITWVPLTGGTFEFSSPIFSNASGLALDGNAAANRSAGRGGTVTGLNWTAGQTLWLRFVETNDTGNDHALAIDNFTFFAPVPEPRGWALAALGMAALWFRCRRGGRAPAAA